MLLMKMKSEVEQLIGREKEAAAMLQLRRLKALWDGVIL
jgi:hypothetical protein